MTTRQVRAGTKTITRRNGWLFLKPGDVVMAVEKCQGLKKGERIIKIRPIRILDTRREMIVRIDKADCIAEGFPELSPVDFVQMYCKANKKDPYDDCTRIKFEYI